MYNLRNALSPSEGAKVVVHQPSKIPLVATSGIVLQPNTETHISMEQVEILRQPPPYTSECRSQWPAEHYHVFPYQSQLCQSFCLDDIIIAKCDCALPYIVEYDRYHKLCAPFVST